MRVALIFILTLCAGTAWARLGETEAQLTNRYGAAVMVGTNEGLRTLTFDFGEYFTQARLRDGKSVAEFAYLKKKGVDLKEGEALAVASRMAGVTNWSEVKTAPFEKTWGAKGTPLYVGFHHEPGKPQSVMVTTTSELQRSAKSNPSSDAGKGF
jgi:hypothetical protein